MPFLRRRRLYPATELVQNEATKQSIAPQFLGRRWAAHAVLTSLSGLTPHRPQGRSDPAGYRSRAIARSIPGSACASPRIAE